MPKVGCTLPEACNYDPTALVCFSKTNHVHPARRVVNDGVCRRPWCHLRLRMSDIPVQGDCDCEGNVVDALGACGGTCAADEDGDGICDDGTLVWERRTNAACATVLVAIYGCGCSDVPVKVASCDCAGNVEDILWGVWRSWVHELPTKTATASATTKTTVWVNTTSLNSCGVCNGPGPVLGCGCNDIPEGYCDCNGNVLDAVGRVAAHASSDINGDGICDDDSIPGLHLRHRLQLRPQCLHQRRLVRLHVMLLVAAPTSRPATTVLVATIDNGVCWYAVEASPTHTTATTTVKVSEVQDGDGV